MYQISDSVTVLYSPAESGSAIIDRGVWNWLPSAILYLLGVLLTVVSIGLLRRRSTAMSAGESADAAAR
jgi:hypothetical protein